MRCDKRLLIALLRELFPKAPSKQFSKKAAVADEAPARFRLLLRAMDSEFTQLFPGLWTESKPRPLLDAGRTVPKPWDEFVAATVERPLTEQEKARLTEVRGKHAQLASDPGLSVEALDGATGFTLGPDQLWLWFNELAATIVSDVKELMNPDVRKARNPSGRNDKDALEPWTILQTEIRGKQQGSVHALFLWYASEEGTIPNILSASALLTDKQREGIITPAGRRKGGMTPQPQATTGDVNIAAAGQIMQAAAAMLGSLSPAPSPAPSGSSSNSSVASSVDLGLLTPLHQLEERVEWLKSEFHRATHHLVKQARSLALARAEEELARAITREFFQGESAPPLQLSSFQPLLTPPPPFPPPLPPPPPFPPPLPPLPQPPSDGA